MTARPVVVVGGTPLSPEGPYRVMATRPFPVRSPWTVDGVVGALLDAATTTLVAEGVDEGGRVPMLVLTPDVWGEAVVVVALTRLAVWATAGMVPRTYRRRGGAVMSFLPGLGRVGLLTREGRLTVL